MRFYIRISPTKEKVPLNYQYALAEKSHNWLAPSANSENSLYSLSWLKGGIRHWNGYEFPEGAIWFISFWDMKFGKRLLSGLQNDPELGFGLEINNVEIKSSPIFGKKKKFALSSPVLLKKVIDGKEKYLSYDDPEANRLLTEIMRDKLDKAGFENSRIKIYFDPRYKLAKTRTMEYNGKKMLASFCPVIIEGEEEELTFAWSVGVGHCTKDGFGALI